MKTFSRHTHKSIAVYLLISNLETTYFTHKEEICLYIRLDVINYKTLIQLSSRILSTILNRFGRGGGIFANTYYNRLTYLIILKKSLEKPMSLIAVRQTSTNTQIPTCTTMSLPDITGWPSQMKKTAFWKSVRIQLYLDDHRCI